MTTATSSQRPATRSLAPSVTRSQEFGIVVAIVVVSIAIVIVNPAFLSAGNLFDLARLLTVNGILALGVLIVLVSGGVDVSFPAIANIAAYLVAVLFASSGAQVDAPVFYALAVPIGIVFGLINGFLIGKFRLPTLIVTLGTSSALYGGALFFLGGQSIFDLPARLQEFSQASLMTVGDSSGAGTSSLHPVGIIVVVLAVLTWLALDYTAVGRKVYALGGNPTVLERSGTNILGLQLIIYGVVGGLAATAGVTDIVLARNANPVSLQGGELAVIAAVVLGGASITGGRGTVIGAMLGVLLLGIVENSLVLVGIPTVWQQVAVGLVLIVGITIPTLRMRRSTRGLPA